MKLHLGETLADAESSVIGEGIVEECWFHASEVTLGRNCKLTRCVFDKCNIVLPDNTTLSDCYFYENCHINLPGCSLSGLVLSNSTIHGSGSLTDTTGTVYDLVEHPQLTDSKYASKYPFILESNIYLEGESTIRGIDSIHDSIIKLNNSMVAVMTEDVVTTSGRRRAGALQYCNIELGDGSCLFQSTQYGNYNAKVTSLKVGKHSTVLLHSVGAQDWNSCSQPVVIGNNSKVVLSRTACKVTIGNNCCAQAETFWGRSKVYRASIRMNYDTEVSAIVVPDGKLYEGGKVVDRPDEEAMGLEAV